MQMLSSVKALYQLWLEDSSTKQKSNVLSHIMGKMKNGGNALEELMQFY